MIPHGREEKRARGGGSRQDEEGMRKGWGVDPDQSFIIFRILVLRNQDVQRSNRHTGPLKPQTGFLSHPDQESFNHHLI